MKQKISCLLFLALSILNAQECNLKLNGSVRDFHNGDVLDEAIVSISELNLTTKSNALGDFSFDDLCAGEYSLTVSHPQCDTKEITVKVEGNTTVNIQLEHHVEELGHIKIEALGNETLSTIENQVRKEDLKLYNSTTLGSALKEISGVDALSTGNNILKPVINGLFASRVQILNAGVRQEGQEWGLEHAPNMDITAFNRLKVVKGGAVLRYGGDAIGGIVIAEPPRFSTKDSLTGGVRVSGVTNGRGGTVSGHISRGLGGNWGFYTQASYRRLGDLRAPNYNLTNTGTEQIGVSTNFGYRTFEKSIEFYYSFFQTDLGILRSAHVGSSKDLFEAITNGVPFFVDDFSYQINAPKQEVQHHLAKVNGHWRFPSMGKLEWQYAFQFNQRKEFDILRGDDFSRAAVDLDLTTHAINLDWEWDRFDDWHFYAGVTGTFQENNPSNNTAARRIIPDYEQYRAGAYASFDHHLTKNLFVEGGIRYDYIHWDAQKFYDDDLWEERGYNILFPDFEREDAGIQLLTNPVFDFHNFSGNGGLLWKFLPNQQLKFNYALTERSPNAIELFGDGLNQSAAIFELGDLRLQPEVSHKFGLNYKANFNVLSGLKIDWFGFYQPVNNFLTQNPTDFETERSSTFVVWEYTQADSRLWGANFDTTLKFTPNISWIQGFAYVNGQDLDNDIPLILISPARWTNSLRYEKKDWKHFYAEIQGIQVFKQNRFPDFNFDISFIDEGELRTELVDISTPPDAYFLLNLKTGLEFDMKQNDSFSIDLFAQNILDTSYRDYLNRLRFFADDVGFNLSLILSYNF